MSDTGSDEERGDELAPNMDDTALAAAARRARMTFDRPTEHELAYFPEIWNNQAATEVFLLIRNSVLATWQYNPWKEVTASDVCRNSIFAPFNSDSELVQNIVLYLTRFGLINFGRYTRATKIQTLLPREERTVIVIGAGAAGIAAATQLTSFGFEVIVIEGRERIGGRAHNLEFTDQRGQKHIMETGADTLRQMADSPMVHLLHQVQLEQHPVFDSPMIYYEGRPLDVSKDAMLTGAYVRARSTLNWQSYQREHRDENGRFISRQQAFENLINLMERDTAISYYNYCKACEEVARAREHHYIHLRNLRHTALMAEKRLKKLKDGEDPLLQRSLKRDIADALNEFEKVAEALEHADQHLIRLKKDPAPKQYMHPMDYRKFNFLLGFEEYIIGAPLEQVQFSNNSFKNKTNGVTTRLTKGVAELLKQLVVKRNVNLRLNHRVRNIDYSNEDFVSVRVEKENGEMEEMTAALVVSTLPIGVLKQSVVKNENAPTFTPPLSEEKVQAIRGMGNGLVNKIILVFERAFWENGNRYQFLTISPDIRTRGSMLLWSAVPATKVITTYMIGHAATHVLPDAELIDKALDDLKKVFGNNCPTPVHAHVTHWENDEFSFGSGSYMSLNTEMKHFDELMNPLTGADGKKRVYFAGEHTCSSYTSTVQGAWMSGVRAAANIANDHVGFGFVDLSTLEKYRGGPESDEIFEVDRDGVFSPQCEEAGPSTSQ
ncbi:unnamed protein product [Caenorhabditis sp. 36 PRJEB53466]|nr:unnamed protein product [Caenorhabditis sp. 36 PRJEB53466]